MTSRFDTANTCAWELVNRHVSTTALPNGSFKLVSFADDAVHPYAILSHTWITSQEVTYNELMAGTRMDKAGYEKIGFCAERAAADVWRTSGWILAVLTSLIGKSRAQPSTPRFTGTIAQADATCIYQMSLC
jgi:hypothetical protein